MRFTLLLGALVAACEGGSGGVAGDTRVVELNDAQVMSICEQFVALLGDERIVDCGNGQTTKVGAGANDLAECVDDVGALREKTTCTLTVDQYETCVEAIGGLTDAQACEEQLPPACAVLVMEGC